MSDIADNANDLVQLEIQALITNRARSKQIYYKLCRNCLEPTISGQAFCDNDCRDDYEMISKKAIKCL